MGCCGLEIRAWGLTVCQLLIFVVDAEVSIGCALLFRIFVLYGPYWLDSVVAGPVCNASASRTPKAVATGSHCFWASGDRNPKPQVAKLLRSRGMGCRASEATSASEPYLVVPIVSIAVPFWGYLLGSLI